MKKSRHPATDVFVSYAAADRALVLPIVQLLEQRKWRVFWDRGIPAGKKWQDVLESRLRKAKCVAVLLTRESLKSSWVTFEASVALERKILIPVLMDPTLDPRVDLPEMYRDLHIVSAPNESHAPASTHARAEWLDDVARLVIQGTRRRLVRLGLIVASCVLALGVLTYIGLTLHNALTTWQAGLTHIERGTYSKQENERLKSAIRKATLIEVLVPNAVSLTSEFRDDFPVFFKNPGSLLRVLFADPQSPFYEEMMLMTTKRMERDAKAREIEKGLPERSKQILMSFADGSAGKLEFRQYDTEFRDPIILVDRKYCFLTVRLTPDQSAESLRLEMASVSAGDAFDRLVAGTLKAVSLLLAPSSQREDNIESCKHHFDSIWARSKVTDDSN